MASPNSKKTDNEDFTQYVNFDFDEDEMLYGNDINIDSQENEEPLPDYSDILQDFNRNNSAVEEEQQKKQLEIQKQKEEEEARLREERVKNFYKKRAEQEELERQKLLEEEEKTRQLELEQQKQNSILSKLGFGKKKSESKQTKKDSKNVNQNVSASNKEKELNPEEKQEGKFSVEQNIENVKSDIDLNKNTSEEIDEINMTNHENETEITIEEKTHSKSETKHCDSKEETVKDNKEQEEIPKKKEKKSFISNFKKSVSKNNTGNNIQNEKNIENENNELLSEQEKWKYYATHDELTKLKNIKAYELDITSLEAQKISIIFFDINNLKYVNDNYGHESGNKLILAASKAIHEIFPEMGYRIGGDEFIVIYQNGKDKKDKINKNIENKINKFHDTINQIAKEDPEKLPYAVSVGFDIGDGKRTISDIKIEADKKMYEAKKKYKLAHPDFDMRHEFKKDTSKKDAVQEPPKEYDTLLSKDQQDLKGAIKNNHRQAQEDSTEKIMMEIQRRNQEILAILIASPTFDHLFIIQDVNAFIDLVNEMENLIDYSYLYVVYDGGPQYYGTDEYYNEVTHIFESVANGLRSGRMLTDKDIQKIKGINIFKNIYIE